MTEDLKRKTLVFIALAAILLVLLAAALPRLSLQPGIPLATPVVTPGAPKAETIPLVTISVSTFFKAAVGVMLILLLIFAIYKMLRGGHLKELMGPLLMILMGPLILLAILVLLLNGSVTVNPALPEVLPTALPVPSNLGPPPTFDFTWLAEIVLALGVIGAGAWQALRRREPRGAMASLQLEAERALQDILAGLDVGSVIIQCYLQMSRALQKERHIELEENMTVREFETLLDRRGFPPQPVHQLTRLFENARYGNHPPAAGDEQKAVSCLEEIVAFCRLTQKTGVR
jgi:hypothetical protein